MIYKVFNMYNIFTFDKENYKAITKNIEDSRGYLCYINPLTQKGKENPRYISYLDLKQKSYTRLAPDHAGTRGPNSISMITGPGDNSKLEAIGRKYGVDDDYYYNYQIIYGDKQTAYVATHAVTLIGLTFL